MSKRRGKFVLSSAEEAQLQQLIRAQSTPQGLAQRARVVQLAAQGMGVRAIGGRVGMHYNQVAKWRRRYLRGGIGALQDEPRPGRKGNISTELLRQIVDHFSPEQPIHAADAAHSAAVSAYPQRVAVKGSP